MKNQKAIEKRQNFIIKTLHRLQSIYELPPEKRAEALELAQAELEMVNENIEPWLPLQKACKALVEGLEND